MIEKLVNSKTRLKILKLFLSHIDDRYYLRELERLLGESLSPLRRQLLKLTSMGILIVEEEANLKYYRLNKNFEGLEELRKMVLGEGLEIASLPLVARNDDFQAVSTPKQFRYDLVALSFISLFVLITAIFVGYVNMKNVKQVVSLISKETSPVHGVSEERFREPDMNNGEMISKKWKVIPGNIPVLSNIEANEEKKSEEL